MTTKTSITKVVATYLCPLCQTELPRDRNPCAKRGCDFGKRKRISVTLK